MRRKAHGRDVSAAGRRGAARAAAAPVGAVTADGAALSARHPPCGALRSARRGVPHDLGSSAGPCGRQARRGPYGCGHADPAFRLGVESERALSHALRRWRVRDRGVRCAGVPGGEITGRGRTSGVGAAAGRGHWSAAGEARPDRAGRGVGVAERGAAEYQAYAASSEQRGMRFSSSRIVSRAMAVS